MDHQTHIRPQILAILPLALALAVAAGCTSSLSDNHPEVLEYCHSSQAEDRAGLDNRSPNTDIRAAGDAGCIPQQGS